jgi:hypothetical protein
MTNDIKRKALTFLVIAAVVMAIIAATLPQLELKPGIPLPGQEGTPGTTNPEFMPLVSITISTFLKALFGILLALVLVYSLYKMIRGTPWRELLGPFLYLALVVVIIVCILFALMHARVTINKIEPEILPTAVVVKGPPLGELPPFLIWLVWLALGVTVVLLGVRLIMWKAGSKRIADPLELEADRAIQALRAGGELKNVIVECYRQMSLALLREQGIELEETMTAREFERCAEARGIPNGPVHQLTLLFEAARYGFKLPGPEDEQKAFDCLHAIVQYSQARRQTG